MFWNTIGYKQDTNGIQMDTFYVKTTPYLRENDPAPHVHGMRSCAAGYLVSVAPSSSSSVRLPRSCRPASARYASPRYVAVPRRSASFSRAAFCRSLPFRSGVSVPPRLSPLLLLRGLLHAQLRRYPHAYHVPFAPASRRPPSLVHVRHHLAPLFTPFRLVVAVNVDVLSSGSLPRPTKVRYPVHV